MQKILLFAVAVAWGSLSAQFLAQVAASLVAAVVYGIPAITGSQVRRVTNLTGATISFAHAIAYGGLLIFGYKMIGAYIAGAWTPATTGLLIASVGTIILVAPRVPGKILLARMCAHVPNFLEEASMRFPVSERVAYARCQAERLTSRESEEPRRHWEPKIVEAQPAARISRSR
jgi:hypothetical protein